jgi:hypothetical protein
MGIAFEMALASLRSTPDCADPVREMVARKIVEFVKAGERDPERLCESALKHFALGVGCAPRNEPPLSGPSKVPFGGRWRPTDMIEYAKQRLGETWRRREPEIEHFASNGPLEANSLP